MTHSYEVFHCQDVSMAIPWPGISATWDFQDTRNGRRQNGTVDRLEDVLIEYPLTTLVGETNGTPLASGYSAANNDLFDRISATWPEEKLLTATKKKHNPRVSLDLSDGSAWGMVIVTAGPRGEIRTFQNFGLPLRI